MYTYIYVDRNRKREMTVSEKNNKNHRKERKKLRRKKKIVFRFPFHCKILFECKASIISTNIHIFYLIRSTRYGLPSYFSSRIM